MSEILESTTDVRGGCSRAAPCSATHRNKAGSFFLVESDNMKLAHVWNAKEKKWLPSIYTNGEVKYGNFFTKLPNALVQGLKAYPALRGLAFCEWTEMDWRTQTSCEWSISPSRPGYAELTQCPNCRREIKRMPTEHRCGTCGEPHELSDPLCAAPIKHTVNAATGLQRKETDEHEEKRG